MKILIVGPSWVGDMMMAQTLFKVIKAQHPDCKIHVLAPAHSRALLGRMPEVDAFIPSPFGHGEWSLRARIKLGNTLQSEKFDMAYVCPNSWKSALIVLAARIPVRIGMRGEWRYGLLNRVKILDPKRWPLMIQRYVALADEQWADTHEKIPHPELRIDPENLAAIFKKCDVTPSNDRVLVLCPGAEFGPAKRWPSEYYAEVAQKKLAEGWQVWLIGSPKEQGDAAIIQNATEHRCLDFTGKTSLLDAIDLIGHADVVVGNDSGLMHIAAAVSKPLVAIYGSTSPGFTPPLFENAQIVRTGIECSPCFKRTCQFGHYKCLTELKPHQILSAIDKAAA
jgi:heptosyltransferase-2